MIAFRPLPPHIEGMTTKLSCIAITLGLLATACSQSHGACGDGTLHGTSDGRVCAYASSVVIEGGFDCPDFAPELIAIEGGFVCAPEAIAPEDLPEEVCPWNADGCHPPQPNEDADARVSTLADAELEPQSDASVSCECDRASDCEGGDAVSACVNCICLPYPATCFDGNQNGTETDVDCGGNDCPRCYAGEACASSDDCATGKCNTDSNECVALNSDEIGCLGLDAPACAACHSIGGHGVNLWPTSREQVVPPPPADVTPPDRVEACNLD